jgi:uncharacterized UBP type Zn finger protein
MFGGAMSSTVVCGTCHAVSRTEEPFYGPLSVEVPPALVVVGSGRKAGGPAATLAACLDAAFAVEELVGDCAYFCDVCARKVPQATLRRALARLPPILILHVIRTSWRAGAGKVQTPVAPQLDAWDLSPWVEALPDAPPPAAAASAATAAAVARSRSISISASTASPLYDLCGSVEHFGSSPRRGHYIAFARHDSSPDSWCSFNDARVASAAPEDVVSAANYIFFYQRRALPR